MAKQQLSFDGFEPANTTPVPDVLFDELLPYLSEAELKVLLYIIRRTSGFKKTDDAISLSQFQNGITKRNGEILDQGCGVKNRTTISNALASLEKKGCIESDKNDDPQGDKATTVYRVRFQSDGVVRKTYHGSTQNVPPVVTETYHGSTDEALPVVRKTYPQETVIQQTALQETVRQESTIVVSAIAENDAPATDNLIDFKKATDGRMKAVKMGDGNASLFVPEIILGERQQVGAGHDVSRDISNPQQIASHSQCLSEEETAKLPAVPKQTPAAGTRSLVVNPPLGGQDDSTSEQATLSVSPADAAQRTVGLPQADSGASTPTARTNGAVQASIPKRPRGRKSLVLPDAKPQISLTEQQQAFWSLWCGVWFNLDIPPDLTETAYGHVKKLAPFIITSEQLTSLIDFTRKDLAASQNIKRKMVQLGNMVHCYAGWKQAQQPRKDTEPVPDFDNYKGNGAEERAARRLLFQEMKARGELIS